ncbi:MAG: sugar ABC transporter substrate-binding protein [Chloroflexota bacterium]
MKSNFNKLYSAFLFMSIFAISVACAPAPQATDNGSAGSDTADNASSDSSDAQAVSLWWHTGTPEEQAAMDDAVERFNAQGGPYTIEKTDLPGGTYTDQVNAAALAGELPCVLDFDGPFLYNFAWSGYMLPIDEFVDADMKADFLPSILDQGTYNGKLYSLGQFDSGLGLYANKAYLEAAGVRIPTFDEPWDLAEFDAALASLADLDEVEFPLDLKINYGRGEWYTYGFSPILQSFGGDLINRADYQSASGVLDGPESVAAMTAFQNWFNNGWVDPAPAGDDSFYGAKTSAISFVGHWMWPAHSEALGDDLVVLPMPDFGGSPVTGMGSWNYGITSNCDNPEGAWEVLKFLVSTEESLAMANANGAVPARLSALEQSDLYNVGGPLYVYVQQLESGRAVPRPVTAGYATITSAFAEAVDNIIAGSDVQEELTRIVEIIDLDIEDNQGYQTQ